jgi:uncharacterized cupredoxin-like copper-binding protein
MSSLRKALGLSGLAALLVVGTAAGVFTARGGASTTAKKAVTVKVTASEFKFALSKRSVPVGSVVLFKVTNKGKISHDFKIAGKKTKTLNPGQTATLKVNFGKKKGKFKYVCTITGHAAAGMKGTFAVGVKAVKPPPPPSTTTTTAPPPSTTLTGTVGSASTTVQVGMFEYRFDLSQSSVPSGQVTFVITNKGSEVHNFSINGVHQGKMLSPGQSETYTVALPAGGYGYVCDVPFHADRGMIGNLTVTP